VSATLAQPQIADIAAPPSPEGATAPGPPDRRRRRLFVAVVAGLVVLAALITALATPRTGSGDLDPDSAEPAGSRALVQVLRAHGVAVQVIRHAADVAHAAADPGRTLVVVQPQLAPLSTLQALDSTSAVLVLVQPDGVTLDAAGLDVRARGEVPAGTLAPGCADPTAARAGTAAAGGQLFGPGDRGDAHPVVCYPDAQDPTSGSVVLTSGRRPAVVLGQADLLRNAHLAEPGNAALALGLLGTRPRLTWYLPDPLELGSGTAGQAQPLSGLLPTWVRWLTLQLGIAAGLAMLWRGRRLGRLVTEPLPVVVRAAQTQEGRARLYREFGGQDRAAATLRTAALRRLARRFSVGPDGDPQTVADLVAAATGRDTAAVRATLLGPPVTTDAGLVRLADEIDAIEQDVSR